MPQDLPKVLAGPILRRVDADLVSVWVALSGSATVSLRIWEGQPSGSDAAPLAASDPPARARRFGQRLFVSLAVLKFEAASSKKLEPGKVYSYDLAVVFDGASGTTESLKSLGLLAAEVDGIHVPLGYEKDKLPTFSLCPQALENLRIVYGSCRRPCSEFPDAMPWIDRLIGDARADPNKRPHQLFLGGDQIYADDVSPLHMGMINPLARRLIGDKDEGGSYEYLRVTQQKTRRTTEPRNRRFAESAELGYDSPAWPPADSREIDLPAELELFPAGGRLDLTQIDGGMTTSDGSSHLFSFGEFAAMYLMVWSEACWPEELPEVAEVVMGSRSPDSPAAPARAMSMMDVAFKGFSTAQLEGWRERTERPDPRVDFLTAWLAKHPADGDARKAYLALSDGDKETFGCLMHALQLAVIRFFADRVGLARLTDWSTIAGKGRFAIRELAETRTVGGDKGWRAHLTSLIPEVRQGGGKWEDVVRAALELPGAVPALTLDTQSASWLALHWTKDPRAEDQATWEKEDFTNLSPYSTAKCVESLAEGRVWKLHRGLDSDRKQLEAFRRDLPRVRRALANVPTYMIFDDHDVTDDWNLTPKWCDQVQSRTFGRQIVRNALIAYAIFQDWGNDPLRYETKASGESRNAHALLLEEAGKIFADGTTGARAAIDVAKEATDPLDYLLGLNNKFKIDTQGRYELEPSTKGPAPIDWHYSCGGPKHHVVVLDNRTRRSFASRLGPPGNISEAEQKRQIPDALPDGRELLVVVAPLEVLTPSIFDALVAPGAYRAYDAFSTDKLAPDKREGRGFEAMVGVDPDAIEGWGMNMPVFEALLSRLASHRQVLILSGDVHSSSSQQLSYWRKGDSQPPARLVQFTCSGMKNVKPGFLVVTSNSLAFAQQIIRSDLGAERLGWNASALDAFDFPPGKGVRDVPLTLRKRMRASQPMLPTIGWPVVRAEGKDPVFTRVKTGREPDWSWRLKPVLDERPDEDFPARARPMPIDFEDFKKGGWSEDAVDKYQQVAARHQTQLDKFGNLRQILFRSCVALVRFEHNEVKVDDKSTKALHAIHELYAESQYPLTGGQTLKPDVLHMARLTPLAGAESRPEDAPLRGSLAEAIS